MRAGHMWGRTDFYPRPPRGGRPGCLIVGRQILQISIHALREEGDCTVIFTCFGGPVFLSTPSARRATREYRCSESCCWDFYPRPPRGGRPGTVVDNQALLFYFYPRPPRGGRPNTTTAFAGLQQFLSTPSARRATHGTHVQGTRTRYFYPRPPRGGRLLYTLTYAKANIISIHALREEGDITAKGWRLIS